MTLNDMEEDELFDWILPVSKNATPDARYAIIKKVVIYVCKTSFFSENLYSEKSTPREKEVKGYLLFKT